MAAAKVLAFRAPEETAPEETEVDSDLREPGEPDSAETVDLDAASTGMAMLLRDRPRHGTRGRNLIRWGKTLQAALTPR